jgi:hypothetical protein
MGGFRTRNDGLEQIGTTNRGRAALSWQNGIFDLPFGRIIGNSLKNDHMKKIFAAALLLLFIGSVITSCSSSRRGMGCPGNPTGNYRSR